MINQSGRVTGRILNNRWQVGARHALYREDGRWYHVLTEFPAALFDAYGYILFETEEEYRNCELLDIGQHLHAPLGISAIPGYIRVFHQLAEGSRISEQQVQYEFGDRQGIRSPEEVTSNRPLLEGTIKQVTVNAYERNSIARGKCIQHYGYVCAVCNFKFENFYGDLGQDFIHVHHLVPLSTVSAEYVVDPIRDLIPVCPNCHAMLHRKDPPFTIEELRERVRQQQENS
jgi:predicted restriction endonuclease